MEKTMSRRGKIRVIAFPAAVFIILLVFAVTGTVRADRLQRQLRATSERALSELDAYLSNMQTDLKKGVYANTPTMIGSMANELRREATAAKSSLAILPLAETRLDNTYKFLSQIGDFVTVLSKRVEMGGTITDEERAQLFALLSYADKLKAEISSMRGLLYDGYLDFEAAESTLSDDSRQIASLSTDMEDAEQALTEYPSLIYDGPFSDHINQLESELLKAAEEITREQALEKAAAVTGLAKEKLSFLGEENDASAAYCFQSDETTVAITKRGGYLLYMLSGKYVGETKLEYTDARRYASEFLNRNGFHNMRESYYTIADGICTINYAYTENEYICYPDLIKVSVSLVDGAVLSADCRGYIMNHKARTFTPPAITAVEAQRSVSPLLSVIDTRLAVIPTESRNERMAYEFHCKNEDGEELLVYINTETGYEDDILLLLYADDGILTK